MIHRTITEDAARPHESAGTRRTDGTFFRTALALALRPSRRNVLHWVSWAIALGIELALVVVLRDDEIYGWEQSLTKRLQDVQGKQAVFEYSSPLTNVISVPLMLLLLAVVSVVLVLQRWWVAVLLVLTVPLHILAQFPKALIDRPRPPAGIEGIEGVGGLRSFPSGHTEYVVTFYGFLAYLLVLDTRGRWARVAIVVAWLVLALATGFGRVAKGRHWPLDVLASYVVGLGLLSGLIWLHSALRSAEANQPLE